MYDNKLLNINGKTDNMLLDAIKIAFAMAGYTDGKEPFSCLGATGCIINEQGLILVTFVAENDKESFHKFPTKLSAEEVFPLVLKWLNSPKDITIEYNAEDMDGNYDHDGTNELGWRVYLEDWGQLKSVSSANVICAIKPAYLWYGK